MAKSRVPVILHIDEEVLSASIARAAKSAVVLRRKFAKLRRRALVRRIVSLGTWR